jgi:hypothetical protein
MTAAALSRFRAAAAVTLLALIITIIAVREYRTDSGEARS